MIITDHQDYRHHVIIKLKQMFFCLNRERRRCLDQTRTRLEGERYGEVGSQT